MFYSNSSGRTSAENNQPVIAAICVSLLRLSIQASVNRFSRAGSILKERRRKLPASVFKSHFFHSDIPNCCYKELTVIFL